MEAIIVILIVALLNGAVVFMDEMLLNLIPITLYADQHMLTSFGGNLTDVLFEVLLGFGVSLIILKFLKKGFECYVLWTDGDPDTEPISLVIRFIQAVAVAICFPTMYEWLAEITEELTNQLLDAIGLSSNFNWMVWIDGLSSIGLTTAIFGLIFVICYFMLFFQFLKRGLEIFILRLGVPLSCVGLLDNDKGVFRTYINKFFQTVLAVVIQIVLCKMGVALMLNLGFNINMLWGISCMAMAIKTPEFLREFMVPATGGSGGMVVNNMYHSVRLVGMAKNLVK